MFGRYWLFYNRFACLCAWWTMFIYCFVSVFDNYTNSTEQTDLFNTFFQYGNFTCIQNV